MHSRIPRADRRVVDTLPSDRPPDRKRRPTGVSPAYTKIEQDVARPKHLTPDQQSAKDAADALNRKRLARLAYRKHGGNPDALERERVEQAEPIPAARFELEAQAEFRQLADMLGLNGGAP